MVVRFWPGRQQLSASGAGVQLYEQLTPSPHSRRARRPRCARLALQLCRGPARRGRYALVVLAAAVPALAASFAGHSFAVAPYNAGLMRDLKLSQMGLSSIWAATMLASALWLNLVGYLIDLVGAQPFIFCGGVLMAVGLWLLAQAEGTLGVAAAVAMLRLSSVETVDFACRHCLNEWFVEHRGAAAGILNTLSSLGFFLPALETMSVVAHGWRTSARLFGTGLGACVVLSSVFLLSRPDDVGLAPDGGLGQDGCVLEKAALSPVLEETDACAAAADGLHGLSWQEALRTSIFWVLVLCWMTMCVPWAGFNFLSASLLESQGHSQSDAAAMYSMMSVMSAASALGSGFLIDKIPRGRKHLSLVLASGCMLLAALAGAALASLPGCLGPALWGSCLGCWDGTANVVGTVIVPEIFGKRHLGTIRAMFMMSAQVSSGAGPLLTALVMDAGLSFSGFCLLLSLLQALGILLICITPPPKQGPLLSPLLQALVT